MQNIPFLIGVYIKVRHMKDNVEIKTLSTFDSNAC